MDDDFHEKLREESKLISDLNYWGTFDNVNRFIQIHNIDWKSEVCLITTLHITCRFGHMVFAKKLIKEGSNIDAKDYWQLSSLSYAVEHSHYEAVT